MKKVPEPDIVGLGGKVLISRDRERLIDLPIVRAKELRRNEAVVYLQRLWAGEPIEELREDPGPGTGDSAAWKRMPTST